MTKKHESLVKSWQETYFLPILQDHLKDLTEVLSQFDKKTDDERKELIKSQGSDDKLKARVDDGLDCFESIYRKKLKTMAGEVPDFLLYPGYQEIKKIIEK